MANIFRIWGKKANTKEQMMPEEIVGQELADEQLEAVIGGCDQPSNQRSYQPQSYGDHHHRHRHRHDNNSSSQDQWQPNSGQNRW